MVLKAPPYQSHLFFLFFFTPFVISLIWGPEKQKTAKKYKNYWTKDTMFFPQPYAVELVYILGLMTCIYAFKMKREWREKKELKD